ncbi:MAG: hypothetical protein EU530_03370 [Promethearchaeota archaeon]|nr:MAG: hypothetical protein EU530_03370 [Candidatus Lokiarchaeota archaeon]
MAFDNEIEKRKTDVRELQDKAFLMFEQAKTLVNENKKDEAISVYLELIKILNILRWANVSKKIQEAIRELQSSPLEEISIPNIQEDVKTEEEEPASSPLRGHVLSLKEFEMYKQQEENIQKEAFALLDSGATLTKQKEFDKAIEDYNQAIILLNSIGWQSYTPQILDEVDKLRQDQKHYHDALTKQMEKPETQTIEDLRANREILQKEIESRKISVKEFEERKKIQYNYLIRATQLLNECEVSINNLYYPEIYNILQKSAQNLVNVGWQEGVTRLNDFISTIKENQFQHELMEQQEHLAFIEKIRISTDIRKYFKNKMLEKQNEKASPFRDVESSDVKSKTKSYEQQVYEVVTEASEILGTDDASSRRKIELYNVAYHLVEKSQWSAEKVKVQSIVTILKTNLENRKQRIQTLEQNKTHTLSTLYAINERIKAYMKEFDIEKESQKANLLKFQEQQQSIQSLENTAFKFIDLAKQSAKKLDFDSAIQNYNQAIEKFTHLRWTEQIPYLIQEVEKIKKLKSQAQTEQQLKDELRRYEEQKKQDQLNADKEREKQELQDLQDISKMISGVVKQKEIDKKSKEKSHEEYRKKVEGPEEEKHIQEFKEMIRNASKKKAEE